MIRLREYEVLMLFKSDKGVPFFHKLIFSCHEALIWISIFIAILQDRMPIYMATFAAKDMNKRLVN